MVDLGNLQAIVARGSTKPLLAVLLFKFGDAGRRQGLPEAMGTADRGGNGARTARAGLSLHVQLERHRGADVGSSRL